MGVKCGEHCFSGCALRKGSDSRVDESLGHRERCGDEDGGDEDSDGGCNYCGWCPHGVFRRCTWEATGGNSGTDMSMHEVDTILRPEYFAQQEKTDKDTCIGGVLREWRRPLEILQCATPPARLAADGVRYSSRHRVLTQGVDRRPLLCKFRPFPAPTLNTGQLPPHHHAIPR